MAAGVGLCGLAHLYNRAYAEDKNKIYRVVLTGGRTSSDIKCASLTNAACGGKSSALSAITDSMSQKGFDVVSVPEVPTILLNGGCKYPGTAPENREKLMQFEKNLLNMQLSVEDAFTGISKSTGKDTIVIYDRAACDIKAYVSKSIWQELLERVGVSESQLQQRYDLVIHLVTAANGAEKFYTLSNNAARSETPEQAIQLDNAVYDAWAAEGRKVVRVDNSTDFKHKLAKVIAEVEKLTQ